MDALKKPSKIATTFAIFQFGDPAAPNFLRVCDASKNVVYRGQVFFGEPALGVALDWQGGGLDEKPFTVTLPTSRGTHPDMDEIVSEWASPVPVSNIKVQVFEILDTGNSDEQRTIYLANGTVKLSRRNPDGKPNSVALEVHSVKSMLEDIKLGIQANAQCVWTYGGQGCGLDNTAFFDPSTYYPNQSTRIRRCFVELRMFYTGLRTQAVVLHASTYRHPGITDQTIIQQPKGWWVGGYLLRGGLAISIRDWFWNATANSGTTTFVLSKFPPKHWQYDPLVRNEVVLVPGCSKTVAACRQRNNEINFGGLGYGIPAYNPIFEEGN